jgi:hypothetical protein
MGKNTQERQEFIINNLRVELDTVEEGVAWLNIGILYLIANGKTKN